MIEIQNMKIGILTPPQIKNNGNFDTNTYIDTAGWNHLRVLFITGVITASSPIGSTAEGTAPLVEECDTTGGSYTAVTGAALADAIADDEDGLLFAIDIDLTKTHKRYMQVQAPHSGDGTPGAALAIIGILSRPDGNGPVNAAQMGLNELITA